MDYPDHTPYGICTCDACEKNQLRQRVAELGKERDEWRSKHDVACLTITNLQSKYECQLSATSKAMQGVAELTAERDALKQQRDGLVAAIKKFLDENNPEGFGCACEPDRLCGPCSEAKRQRPLYAAIATVKEK